MSEVKSRIQFILYLFLAKNKLNIHNQFGSAGAICCIEKRSGPKNLQVSIVLKAPTSAGAKGDVPKVYGFVHTLHPHSLTGDTSLRDFYIMTLVVQYCIALTRFCTSEIDFH